MPVKEATRNVSSHAAPASVSSNELVDPLAGDPLAAHASARLATSGAGGKLPHQERIQASFGDAYDVNSIVAHTDSNASDALADVGAKGLAIGNHAAFDGSVDVHTAAHEAAHAFQQQAGVQLAGGVGGRSDAYEQHANAVADRVVRGEPAGELLSQKASPGASGAADAVQFKYMDIDAPGKEKQGGVLATVDPIAGSATGHAIAFGSTNGDGVATKMEGYLFPGDDIVYGGKPSTTPSWWAQMHIDAEAAKPGASAWISNYVVQGHLLNDNLGGPGHDMRNLTPIAKGCNSHHSAKVETDAKSIFAAGNILKYSVYPQYGAGPDPSWFDNNIPALYLKKFPRSLKIEHDEYHGTTRTHIRGVSTETTNAKSGKG